MAAVVGGGGVQTLTVAGGLRKRRRGSTCPTGPPATQPARQPSVAHNPRGRTHEVEAECRKGGHPKQREHAVELQKHLGGGQGAGGTVWGRAPLRWAARARRRPRQGRPRSTLPHPQLTSAARRPRQAPKPSAQPPVNGNRSNAPPKACPFPRRRPNPPGQLGARTQTPLRPHAPRLAWGVSAPAAACISRCG